VSVGAPRKTASTSASAGIEGAVPGRVTDRPAVAQPKRTASGTVSLDHRAAIEGGNQLRTLRRVQQRPGLA
jgi:hypothetical protein